MNRSAKSIVKEMEQSGTLSYSYRQGKRFPVSFFEKETEKGDIQ